MYLKEIVLRVIRFKNVQNFSSKRQSRNLSRSTKKGKSSFTLRLLTRTHKVNYVEELLYFNWIKTSIFLHKYISKVNKHSGCNLQIDASKKRLTLFFWVLPLSQNCRKMLNFFFYKFEKTFLCLEIIFTSVGILESDRNIIFSTVHFMRRIQVSCEDSTKTRHALISGSSRITTNKSTEVHGKKNSFSSI